MDRPARLAAALLLTATLTGTSAGCSRTEATPAAPSETVTASTAPAPVAVKTGDLITAEQAAALDTKVQRAWTMTDGTIVATTLAEALPATVVADITTVTQAANPGTAADANYDGLEKSLATSGTTVGRRIIAVFPLFGARTRDGAKEHFWSTTMFNGGFDTADQAVAGLASLTAANPTGNVVVVLS